MTPCKLRFCLSCGSVLYSLLVSIPTAAEIVPDTTLPINSTVAPQDTIKVIEGGTSRGNNLFHSFQEFSISTRDTAFFNNDFGVKNIIARVTGGVPSSIDGIIQANGIANLLFINPKGIIFGQNASLDIGGSFVASTANSLKFADGTEFSAAAPESSPLLTVSVPVGLQMGANPGAIVNQSQASLNGAVNSIGFPAGLQVQSGKTLTLVAGNISLQGGNLTAAGGRIELGSVAGGFVHLSEIETGYALGYADVQNFGDIQLSQGAQVDTSNAVDISDSGGGAIQLQGKTITLTETSLVFSITSGSKTGDSLVVNAAESVRLSEGSNIATFSDGEGRAGDVLLKAWDFIELVGIASANSPSFVGSQVCLFSDCQSVTGNGGNLTLETRQLSIRDGAIADASTFGAGQSGNVLVRALDTIELVGTTADGAASGIFAQVADQSIADAGDAGTIRIETKQLTIQGGAQISTAARNGGNGGDLTINASDAIQLIGASPLATADLLDKYRSGIFVSAEQGATGDVGNLNITTELLIVEDGARISADNIGSSNTGGNATLNVRQLMIRDGGEIRAGSFSEGSGGTLTVNAAESVEIIGSGMIGSEPVKSTLFTQAEAAGDAGDLTITTRNLMVRDSAEVTVSGRSSGDAGNLTVEANSISLDNQATLSADTKAGQGNINLNSVALVLRRGSNITTNAEGSDITGGNININADVLAALENSDISANSADFRGGNVAITAQGIFGTQFREQLTPESDITATGANSSLNGQVTINTPDVDPSQGLTELPVEPVNVEVAQGCQLVGNQSAVAFFNTGRGGLAPNPYEPISSSNIWEDVPLPTQEIVNSASSARASTSPNTIVEAKGWIVNEKGEVIFVAEMPTNLSQNRCSLR